MRDGSPPKRIYITLFAYAHCCIARTRFTVVFAYAHQICEKTAILGAVDQSVRRHHIKTSMVRLDGRPSQAKTPVSLGMFDAHCLHDRKQYLQSLRMPTTVSWEACPPHRAINRASFWSPIAAAPREWRRPRGLPLRLSVPICRPSTASITLCSFLVACVQSPLQLPLMPTPA